MGGPMEMGGGRGGRGGPDWQGRPNAMAFGKVYCFGPTFGATRA